MVISHCPNWGDVTTTTTSCYNSAMSDDVLMEILVRLPFKSLTRFQCVCKSWHGLITGDYLRRRLPLIMSGVFFHDKPGVDKEARYACASDDGGRIGDSDLSFFPCHKSSTIIDGCNGLLLYYTSFPTAFYVVSPTTKRWVALPTPRKKTQLSILAFDPYSSPHYKVVCFTGWLARGAEIEVFSSETGEWHEHAVQFGLDTDAMSATMHYSDGVLYILAYSGDVVSIDLANLACKVTALPAPMNCKARVGHCRGHLRYTCNDVDQLKIWELKDMERSEWSLKHAMSVREVIGEGNGSCQVSFLAFHPEREVVYLWVPWKLVCYDLQKRRVEKEWVFESEEEGAYLVQIWLFPFSSYLSDCSA